MIPVLPDSAPFTPEQRGWLNGYLAARFGGTTLGPAPPSRDFAAAAQRSTPPSHRPPAQLHSVPTLTILWGSQTGNAEALARRTARTLAGAGASVAVHDMAAYPTDQLCNEEILLVITSTYGDGEPPDNAAAFHGFLLSARAPKLDGCRFAVFALGDSDYPDFCACGKQIDSRLDSLGATRLLPRVDADVDFDEPFAAWQSSLLAALPTRTAAPSAA
jgi:sulfite reductase (NADPH) flavoprotein alpha-component